MKSYLTILLFTLATLPLSAQTDKGNTLLIGSSNLGFSSTKSKMEYDGQSYGATTKNSSFSLSPSVYHFVANNFAIGITLDTESETNEVDEDKSKSVSTLIGPGVRAYLSNATTKPYIFADYLMGSSKETYDDGDDKDIYKMKSAAFDLGIGISAFITKNIAFDFALGYVGMVLTSKDDSKAKYKTKGIGLNVGILVSL